MLLTSPLLAVAAAALQAPEAVDLTPAAKVTKNLVVHAGEGITVRVPASARYVGSERFALYGVADAEIHVFAETDENKRLQKLYWIQFESYLPSNTHSYNYADGNKRMMLWDTPTWVRSGPVPTNGPTRAGSDREHVLGILNRAGIAIPPEAMNVRMVQLLDDPAGTGKGARRELMVIYSEDLARSGKTLAQLAVDGKPGPDWAPIEQGLIDRASKAVTIERRK